MNALIAGDADVPVGVPGGVPGGVPVGVPVGAAVFCPPGVALEVNVIQLPIPENEVKGLKLFHSFALGQVLPLSKLLRIFLGVAEGKA